jgi:medium-chain acyl-[acyl-carrier-protein] hydrolase
MNSAMDSSWFNVVPTQGDPGARLFCLPCAGGGTAIYYPWRDLLLDEVALVRIQLPGRETRLRERSMTRMRPLIKAIIEELAHYIDLPIFLFGHSMGALIAFELSRELRRKFGVVPAHLFVSGRRAPQIPNPDPIVHELPDKEFIDYLIQYEGIPEIVTESEELLDLFLPILRADFELLDHYQYQNEPLLDCPITAFGGLSDPKIAHDDVRAWRAQTSGQFNCHLLKGGHFFINDSKNLLLELVNTALRPSLLSN